MSRIENKEIVGSGIKDVRAKLNQKEIFADTNFALSFGGCIRSRTCAREEIGGEEHMRSTVGCIPPTCRSWYALPSTIPSEAVGQGEVVL